MSEVDKEDAQELVDALEELVREIDAIGIFTHNLALALPMFIPGLGAGWGLFTAWSTGHAFAAITTLSPAVEALPALAVLYLTPFGLMELTAYSLGTSRSYILFMLVIRRQNLRPSIKATLTEAGTVATLLLVGGFIELWMIEAL